VLDLRGTTACWVWRERYCTKLEGTTVGTGTGGNERIGTGKACRTQCDVDNREAAFMHLQLLKTISQDNFSRRFPNTLSQSMVLLPLSELAQQMLCVCLQTSSASFSITQTCQPKDPGLYHQFESRHQGCLVRHVPAKIAHGGHKLYV